MARYARLIVPGLPVHVAARGNYRQDVFYSAADRNFYLQSLERRAVEQEIEVLGWCLMTNHVHLLLVPGDADAVARVMRRVQGDYARYLNRRNESPSGHVWQGRYYSCLVDGDRTWTALRYIELNPVRAGVVGCAEHSDWSSAAFHCGTKAPAKMLALRAWSQLWSPDRWRDVLLHGRDEREIESIREATKRGLPVGSDEFIEALEARSGRSLRIRPVGRPAAA
jgi:putative transposase